MATNIPQEDFHKTGLRLPKELHERLHEAAAESGRSYNSEILARLQLSFEGGDKSAEIERLRMENATLQHMVDGKSLGTDLAAILAVALAGQTLGMIDSLSQGKQSPREMQSLRSFAELVLQKQPMDWPTELMRAYEETPSAAGGARAKRELEVLRRIAQSLAAYYDRAKPPP